MELKNLKEYFGYSYSELVAWLLQLNPKSTDAEINTKERQLKIAKLLANYKQRYTLLNKSKTIKGKQELELFLCTPFDYDFRTCQFDSLRKEETRVITDTLKDLSLYWKNEAGRIASENQVLIQEINREKKALKGVNALQKQLKITEKNKEFVQLKYRAENKRLRERARYWENLSSKYKNQLQKSKAQFETESNELRSIIEKIEQDLKEKDAELRNVRDEKESLDLESRDISFTQECKNGKYTYTASTDLCVMQLLDSHVPYEHVEKVIRSVLDLCNLKIKDSLPKKDYVAKVNTRRLALGQINEAEVIQNADQCTLYSDETRKNGRSFGSFLITNENKEPVLLGLRQMSSKASKTELDTLKSILDDVNQRCESLTHSNSDMDKRVEILRKINSTMSDRAATEISFKELLNTYRSDLMKDHVDHFDSMSPEEQYLITRMFNFFCGLHLLVNIAELLDSIFKQWESSQLGSESTESGILRTVRNVSKAFAPGADNKNGASLEFTTYVKRKGVHNLQIKSFLGNRFNIVFHNGGVIYCLRDYIVSFLKDVKSEGKTSTLNWLLGSILADLNVNEYVVGLRALGVVNKFITAPLWKLLECKTTHILDMNEYYGDLVQYLEAVATNTERAQELLTGEYIPFSVEIKKDDIWVKLVSQSDNDALTVSLLMQICAGMCKLLKEKVKDHLEGGIFHDMDEHREDLRSVLPHNKLPEWVFGYLDWMLKHRPNATRLANEAHIVFQVNNFKILKQSINIHMIYFQNIAIISKILKLPL